MLGRSAFPDEVLIIHLCLTGNESTVYSKHPFERGKHIEMNFVTKLEPFSLLPCFCINSSFLSSSSCRLQHCFPCFFFPPIHLPLLSFSHTFLSLVSCFVVLILYLTLGTFSLPFIFHFNAVPTQLCKPQRLNSIFTVSGIEVGAQDILAVFHTLNALCNLSADISPILRREPRASNVPHQSPHRYGAKQRRTSEMTMLSLLRKVVSCTF